MEQVNIEAQKHKLSYVSPADEVVDHPRYTKNKDSVLRALLELQFEAHFIIIQILGCYLATTMSIFDAVNAIATNTGDLPTSYSATMYSK